MTAKDAGLGRGRRRERAGDPVGDLVRLREAFAGPEPPRGDEPPGASAVLIPLFRTGGDLSILFTRRSQNLSSHPGQVSFPGGRVDPGDSDPCAAALREAEEEVGIRPGDVDVLGHLTDFTTYYGRLVCAYVGYVDGEPPEGPTSPDEVDEVFLKPLPELLAPDAYEGRRIASGDRDGVVHYWHVEPHAVWGITGELLARYLRRAHGWAPPAEPRPIREAHEFMPEVRS